MLNYHRISYVIVGTIVACGVFLLPHQVSAAEGDCSHIKDLNKRLVCVEQKADALTVKLAATDKKLAEADRKLADISDNFNKKVRDVVQGALQRVKIEQAAHPSICLFFKDHDQPAYAISDCSHTPEQTFNIHQ